MFNASSTSGVKSRLHLALIERDSLNILVFPSITVNWAYAGLCQITETNSKSKNLRRRRHEKTVGQICVFSKRVLKIVLSIQWALYAIWHGTGGR